MFRTVLCHSLRAKPAHSLSKISSGLPFSYVPSVALLHSSPFSPQDFTKIIVPKNGVKFSFSRSGGPGGMNVNKVSTRATLRFRVDSAGWLPIEVRERLCTQNGARIGKDGDFSLSSDVHRTQPRNIDDCMQRLQAMVNEACKTPKVRKQRVGLGKETKRRRTESKRRRSDVKKSRGKNKDW